MEEEKVAETLFDYFEFNEFLTRDIPADVMTKLTGLMEIHDNGPGRNIKVGQYIRECRQIELPDMPQLYFRHSGFRRNP